MNFKAVVFDLDGTLLDTVEDLADSMNAVLENYGFPVHTTQEYYYFVGKGMENLVLRALPEGHKDEFMVQKALLALSEEYEKRITVKTKLYDGIPELLDSLTEKGYKLNVLSNKTDKYTKFLVKEFLSKWSFELIIGARENLPKKPDPSGALEIIEKLKLSPENFLYLGDTGIDMKTANAAGMYPIGVLWGFREADELKKYGAKKLIENPLELMELF